MLFISNLYPPMYVGGYELACSAVAQGLEARGHDIRVLTSDYRAEEIREREPGVYRRLWLKKGWRNPKPKVTLFSTLNTLLVQRHNVREMDRAIKALGPDAVMFWNGMHLGYGILSAAEKRARVAYYLSDPWLAEVLELQQPGRKIPWRLRIYRNVLRSLGIPFGLVRTDHLIFCSQALKDQYLELGADARLGSIIHHGVSRDLATPGRQRILSRAPEEPYRVLFVGQIVRHKGVSTLVEALALLRALPGLENTRLGLLGSIQSEEYGAELQAQISSLGLGDAIDFLPGRPRAEVPVVFAEYDVLAFPSEWSEPFSLTLLEAMAAGLPVVSSLTGGSVEIVRDGENAAAFRAGSAPDLANKLARMLLHPQEAAAIGRRAREEVLANHTLDAQVDAIEQLLRRMVSTPN